MAAAWRCYQKWTEQSSFYTHVVFMNGSAAFSFPSIHPTRITPAAYASRTRW